MLGEIREDGCEGSDAKRSVDVGEALKAAHRGEAPVDRRRGQ